MAAPKEDRVETGQRLAGKLRDLADLVEAVAAHPEVDDTFRKLRDLLRGGPYHRDSLMVYDPPGFDALVRPCCDFCGEELYGFTLRCNTEGCAARGTTGTKFAPHTQERTP